MPAAGTGCFGKRQRNIVRRAVAPGNGISARSDTDIPFYAVVLAFADDVPAAACNGVGGRIVYHEISTLRNCDQSAVQHQPGLRKQTVAADYQQKRKNDFMKTGLEHSVVS